MIRTGAVQGVPTPCVVELPQGAPLYSVPNGHPTKLATPYRALCVGLEGDDLGAYVLHAGGLRYFRLADVAGVNRLVTVHEAAAALVAAYS